MFRFQYDIEKNTFLSNEIMILNFMNKYNHWFNKCCRFLILLRTFFYNVHYNSPSDTIISWYFNISMIVN